MTEEQILELAKNCEFEVYTNDDGTLSDYFDCYAEQLLKFALAIHEDGYNKGYNKASYDAELYEHAGNSYD